MRPSAAYGHGSAADWNRVEVTREQAPRRPHGTGEPHDQVPRLELAGDSPVHLVDADPARPHSRLAQLPPHRLDDAPLASAQPLDGQQVHQMDDPPAPSSIPSARILRSFFR